MNSPFSSPPPIPTPDGQVPIGQPATAPVSRDWKSAPAIIRSWAYQLTWVAMFFLLLGLILSLFTDLVAKDMGGRIVAALFYALILALFAWLNRGIKKGQPTAWTVQIIVSIIGLLFFPLWTIVNVYILSQWFKPETKAWFGQK